MLLQSWHKNILVGIQSNTVNMYTIPRFDVTVCIWHTSHCSTGLQNNFNSIHIKKQNLELLPPVFFYYLLYSSNNIHHSGIVEQLFDVSFASQHKLLTEKEFLSLLLINLSVAVNHMVVYTVVYTVFTANDNWCDSGLVRRVLRRFCQNIASYTAVIAIVLFSCFASSANWKQTENFLSSFSVLGKKSNLG